MNRKRTLLDAFQIDAEKQRFIDHGKEQPLAPPDGSPALKVAAQEDVTSTAIAEPTVTRPVNDGESDSIRPRKPAKRGKKTPVDQSSSRTHPPLTQAVVSITTRFKPETAEALRRASLQRKLEGRSQASQQLIVETAVASWLEKQGYLSAK